MAMNGCLAKDKPPPLWPLNLSEVRRAVHIGIDRIKIISRFGDSYSAIAGRIGKRLNLSPAAKTRRPELRRFCTVSEVDWTGRHQSFAASAAACRPRSCG
jgi:hypothetical protein